MYQSWSHWVIEFRKRQLHSPHITEPKKINKLNYEKEIPAKIVKEQKIKYFKNNKNVFTPKQLLGMSVGSQATLANADAWRELIRASSETPPDKDNGPTGSTLHKISSL